MILISLIYKPFNFYINVPFKTFQYNKSVRDFEANFAENLMVLISVVF